MASPQKWGIMEETIFYELSLINIIVPCVSEVQQNNEWIVMSVNEGSIDLEIIGSFK